MIIEIKNKSSEIENLINSLTIPKTFFSFRDDNGTASKISNEFLLKLFVDCATKDEKEEFIYKLKEIQGSDEENKIELIDMLICSTGEKILNIELIK